MRRSVAFACAAVWLVASAPAALAVASSGPVLVVDGGGSSKVINSGGSATVFSLKIAENPECPGDSADDDYRVQSFIVPKGTDVGTMRFKSQGPDVAGGWAAYKTSTNAYIQEMTADAPKKGDPGPIIDLPDLSFAVFTGGELTPGRYEIGVACSLYNDVEKYWSTEIDLSKDASDSPAQLRWRLVSEQKSAGSDSSPMVPLGVAVVVGTGAVLVMRRRKAAAA